MQLLVRVRVHPGMCVCVCDGAVGIARIMCCGLAFASHHWYMYHVYVLWHVTHHMYAPLVDIMVG